jgi:hypothetical protein
MPGGGLSLKPSLRRLGILLPLLAACLATPGCQPVDQIWGDFVSEPRGDLACLALVREDLTIDLRPLKDHQQALVEALYAVRNEGPETTLDFQLFPIAVTKGGGDVVVDGQSIAGRATQSVPWLGESDPGFYRYAVIPMRDELRKAITFPMTLSPGPHLIRVRYRAQAFGDYSTERPTIGWSLSYHLAPARLWGRFGVASITVHVPPGWNANSQHPLLSRKGDTLVGSWTRVSDDWLILTTSAPARWRFTGIPAILLVLGALFLERRITRAIWPEYQVGCLIALAKLLWGSIAAVLTLVAGVIGWIAEFSGIEALHGAQYDTWYAWNFNGYVAAILGLGALTSFLLPLISIPDTPMPSAPSKAKPVDDLL